MALSVSPAALIASVPPVTRSFTALTIVSSIFYAWKTFKDAEPVPYLTLVPGSSLFYPWTFVTSALVETSIVEVYTTKSTDSFKPTYSLLYLLSQSQLPSNILKDYGEASKYSSL